MSIQWTRREALSTDDRLDVISLLNRTESLLGREAIDEGRRRTVVHGGTALHWLGTTNGTLTAYAQSTVGENVTVEMCGGGYETHLQSDLLSLHRRVDWWLRDVTAQPPEGGEAIRKLLLLDVALPIAAVAVPEGALLRTFQVGRDEDAWLVQNNEAFAHHPEQGAWIRADLEARTKEPWFDPSGFLLLEIDGRIAASCWTKIHELHPERFGEIYVISVHPQFQGRNLGRIMVTQGLRSLRERGVQRGKLFVDESNVVAVSMYEHLGFAREREDQLLRFSA